MPDRRRRRARHRRRVVAVGLLAAAGTGLGLGVSAATASGPIAYRTALASVSSVSRTLGVPGTLDPVTEATAAFQVSGTVASVVVTRGDKITAGQIVATLDPTSLQAGRTEAQQTLASAEAKLNEDELDETPSSSASPTATAALTSIVLTSASKPTSSNNGNSSLGAAQSAVVADQHAVDTDLQAATADLAAMQKACAAGTTTAPPTSTTSTTTPTSTTSTTSTTVPSSTGACATALAAAGAAEQKVSTDQNALAKAETALATLLSAQSAQTNTPTTKTPTTKTPTTKTPTTKTPTTKTPTTKTPTTRAVTPSTTTPHSASSGSTSDTTNNTDTPEQLASDEATIDQDQAALVEAQQSLAAATLVSPVSGTVESIGLAAGDTVSAGSSSDGITVVDWKSYEVSATLTTSQVEDVKVGQDAQVTVDGTSGTLAATVTRVGPVQESNSSFSYPVVATITSTPGQLAAGSAAQLVIDLSRADSTLVVPTSAVHTTSTGSYVYLDRDGREVRQTVKTGLVGDVHTQITSGLARGDSVILADPSQAVPSSSANTFSSSTNTFSSRRLGGPPGG